MTDDTELQWPLSWWVAFVVWFFGAWKPELRLLPFRRLAVSLAFRMRWIGLTRASNALWYLARIAAVERTHPALAAYSTKVLMSAFMDGRE